MNQVHLLSSHLATTMLVRDTAHSLHSRPEPRHLVGSVGTCGMTRRHTHLQEQPHHLGLAVQRGLMQRRARFGLAVDLNPRSQQLPVEAGESQGDGGRRGSQLLGAKVKRAAGQGTGGTLLAPQEGDEEMKVGERWVPDDLSVAVLGSQVQGCGVVGITRVLGLALQQGHT